MTTDCALGSLQSRWAQTDAGWSLDSPLGRLWVSCLACADDILVFARTELALTQMISECCVEFGKIGVEVALDNKNFLVQLCGRHWEISCGQWCFSPVVSNT